MILQALYRLAHSEGLVSDPDFQPASVSWAVRVDRTGKILGFDDLRREDKPIGKRAPRLVPAQLMVPLQAGRTGTKAPPNFLVDNAKYVFGQPTEDKQFSEAEGREKSGWFLEQVRRCAAATRDEGVAAVLAALERWNAGERVDLPVGLRSNEQFAFLYTPDVDTYVHERTAVVEYWRSERGRQGKSQVDGGATMECVITGEVISASSLFPKVKKVPGGQSSGALLVSFNAPAFESYGLSSSGNAPMSQAAAEAAGTALRRLVDRDFPDPRDPKATLPRRSLKIGDDTLVCYWSDGTAGIADVFAPIMESVDPEEVPAQYRSIWRGIPVTAQSDAFYVLTISGAQGRIVVRDWIATTADDVCENLAMHFRDLQTVRNTPQPRDRALSEHLPLGVLLSGLAPFGRKDAIPDALASAIVRSAIGGGMYPVSVLQKAIERARAEIAKSDYADMERRDARAMLIKAVLVRTFHHEEIGRAMDPSIANSGYLCGRLLALIERMQQLALGDVNASVVDRYFGAASATPRTVFVRLLRNSKHHERKAMDDESKKGIAINIKRAIDEIADKFDARNNGFPAHLSLEDQGMFILGYHQQRHSMFTKRNEQ